MFRPVLNSPLLKNIFKDKNVLVTGGATGLGKILPKNIILLVQM